MTTEDIQRVINMCILQKIDPTHGGYDTDFVSTLIDNDFVSSKPGHSGPVFDVKQGTYPTTETLADVVRQRYAPVINYGVYQASLTRNNGASGWTLALTRIGGHYLAVNGFRDRGTPNVSLLIYDPVYADPTWKSFPMLPTEGVTAKDGTPLSVVITSPTGNQPPPAFAFPIWQNVASAPNPSLNYTSLADVPDKYQIIIVEYWSALHLD
jgi:hypothetical protein